MPIATNNMIVSRFSPELRAKFDPLVSRVALPAHRVLARPGEKITSVHFLESGLAATGWGAFSRGPDVALIGREGLVGHSIALGVEVSPNATIMRIEGAALAMPLAEFRSMLAFSEFRSAILHYAHDITNQIAECALAHATMPVLARVARFLLLVSERVGASELVFTHEAIAAALGCRRAGVTLSIHVLEGEGALKARRNRIIILDRSKLEAHSAPDRDRASDHKPSMTGAPIRRIPHLNGSTRSGKGLARADL